MLVRVRSRDGNFRFELQPSDDITVLVNKILETSSSIDSTTLALSNAPRGGENLVSNIQGDLETLGIKHGDLLFASYTPLATPSNEIAAGAATSSSTTTASTLSGKLVVVPAEDKFSTSNGSASAARSSEKKNPTTAVVSSKPWELVKEAQVDEHWEKQDGKIPREKGKNGCRCGPKSMCDYCMPLEPFDAEYQSSHGIKHLSYHSYLRKINSAAPASSQSTSYIPPLSDPSYRVKVPCSSGSHPSWPAGICTKCQPSAVTLSRQTYRMVDHVEFVQPSLIEGLLSFWRQTGTQRFGFLLGRFEPYAEVPMGIKAVVEAIHEPPQEGHADGVTVGMPWADEERVERLATACGLQVVGMIYTDLQADTSDKTKQAAGKVVPKRHANSFFLSSLEVIFAATLQRQHPTPSRFAATGQFSSRFVTCVLSGDLSGDIAVEAYQVSDQAMAMVDADMIEASVEPGTMRVKDEGPERYIPDVFYRYKNAYGIEVKESAKPCFPVEYLLVNVTHGFPKIPRPQFVTETPFAVENRQGLRDQTMAAVASAFAGITRGIPREVLAGQVVQDDLVEGKGKGRATGGGEDGSTTTAAAADKVAKWLSDWHLLAYLDESGLFEKSDIQLMAQIAKDKDSATLYRLFQSPNWQTFLAIAEEQAPAVPTRDYPTGGAAAARQPSHFDDGFEIPPDVDVPPEAFHNQFNSDSNSAGAGGGGSGGVGGDDVDMSTGDVSNVRDAGAGAAGGDAAGVPCPTCTFINEPGTIDCAICGLPVSG